MLFYSEHMKKLNQYIFKKRVQKYLQQSTRNKRFVDYNNANSVLLVFESDYIEKNRFIRKVISQLTADGKKVSAWGFLDKKLVNTAILPNFKIMDRTTTDWFECPKEQFIKELQEEEYDLLIDLSLNDHLPLQYINLYANAAFKTGMSRSMNEVMDFVIQIAPPEKVEITAEDENKIEFEDINESLFHTDQQFLFEQIIFYLKKIQTKD